MSFLALLSDRPLRVVLPALEELNRDLKLEPLQSVSDLDDAPHTLLIVLGDTTVLDQVPGGMGMKDFLEHGGAILLATDRAMPDNRLRQDFGFSVTGTSFQVNDRGAECYKNFAECPFLIGVRGADPDLLGELPAGQGVRLDEIWYALVHAKIDPRHVSAPQRLVGVPRGEREESRLLLVHDRGGFVADAPPPVPLPKRSR